jgi:solute carrier family 25 carnitine/acylcarnitine transporter 20/29
MAGGIKSNSLTIARSIVRDSGIAALFRGTFMTFLRDVPTGFVYFATYEGIKRFLKKRNGEESVLSVLFAGGCAGMLNWTLAIPIDTIKSRIQSSPVNYGFRKTLYDLLRQSGVQGLFKGLTPTLIRAFPASASLFLGVEMSRKQLDKFF